MWRGVGYHVDIRWISGKKGGEKDGEKAPRRSEGMGGEKEFPTSTSSRAVWTQENLICIKQKLRIPAYRTVQISTQREWSRLFLVSRFVIIVLLVIPSRFPKRSNLALILQNHRIDGRPASCPASFSPCLSQQLSSPAPRYVPVRYRPPLRAL